LGRNGAIYFVVVTAGVDAYGWRKAAKTRWDEIVVIHQARPRSLFAMNGTWLNPRVQARVIQTLKTGRLATAPGKVIEFEHEAVNSK
jgi:hypothetical protein